MTSRTLLRYLLLGITLTPLTACMAPRQDLASNEGVSLEGCEAGTLTGTRIRASRADACRSSSYPMKSYSATDLQATGEIDLGDALREIDPAFR